MRDPWRIAALALGAMLYFQVQRCRRAEAKLSRLIDAGLVDFDDVLENLQAALNGIAVAGGVRRIETPDRSEARPALRVLP